MKMNTWDDYYTRKARKEGYPARSVYKLEEIQKRCSVLRRGSKVLDLGCCPGAWLQFASKAVGRTGLIVGVDIIELKNPMPSNVRFVCADALTIKERVPEELGGRFDTILSDMAPKTSGNKFVDTQRSLALCGAALDLCAACLKPKGAFVCKLFFGDGFDEFTKVIKEQFKKVKLIRPKSTRKASREIYVIAKRG